MSDWRAMLAEIGELRGRVLSHATSRSAEELMHTPEGGGWSVAEIVEHLVLAEDYGIRGLWAATEAAERGEFAEIAPELAARSVDEVFAGEPPKLDAPGPVVPSSGGRPLGYWRERLRSHQAAIETLAAAMDVVGMEKVVYPHFRVGPLDGVQRIGFFRWHLARHLSQTERTLGS